MPPACIICGQSVATHVAKSFSWRPKWMSIGFWSSAALSLPAAGLLAIGVFTTPPRMWVTGGFCLGLVCCAPLAAVLIAGFLRTRRATVECPLCERHRGYWAWRGFWLLAPLLGLVAITLTLAVLILLRQISDSAFGYLFFGATVLLLGWAAVAALLHHGMLRAVEITDDDIVLAPVHQLFVDLLKHGRRQTAALDYGWEEYDPYPRRPLGKPGEPGKKAR